MFYFCGIEVLQETCTLGRDAEASSDNMSSVPGCTSNGTYPGDYSSVFSLVTNTELQPVKALLSYSLVCRLVKGSIACIIKKIQRGLDETDE